MEFVSLYSHEYLIPQFHSYHHFMANNLKLTMPKATKARTTTTRADALAARDALMEEMAAKGLLDSSSSSKQ